jgi:hypothetical protein
VLLIAAPLLGSGQVAPDLTSAIYRGAYRNALHLIASAHAQAVATEGDIEGHVDRQLCATIGLTQSDLNILLAEDGLLSNDLNSLRSTAVTNGLPQATLSQNVWTMFSLAQPLRQKTVMPATLQRR